MNKEKKKQLKDFKKIVVDLGCAGGSILAREARENPNVFYIGVENNKYAIKKAHETFGHYKNLAFLHADATELPLKKGKIDEASARYMFSRLDKIIASKDSKRIEVISSGAGLSKEVINEVHRILKEGKKFKVQDTSEIGAKRAREELAKSKFESAGKENAVEIYKKLKLKKRKH